jgi:hypothetical protein
MKMKFKTALISMFLLAFMAVGYVFSAELQLQGEAREHSFVKVTSDESGKWIVLGPNALVYSEQFKIEDVSIGSLDLNTREVIVLDDGKTCVFCGPEGVYAVLQWPQEDAEISHITVKIGDSPIPVPTPKPKPKPEPEPKPIEVPEGEFGVSKPVLNALIKMKADKEVAKKIASNFESISAKISAGGYDDGPFDVTYPDGTEGSTNDAIEAIILDTMVANAEAAGGRNSETYEEWKEGVFVLVSTKLNDLQDTKLNTIDNHADCWRELGVPFRAYGESK